MRWRRSYFHLNASSFLRIHSLWWTFFAHQFWRLYATSLLVTHEGKDNLSVKWFLTIIGESRWEAFSAKTKTIKQTTVFIQEWRMFCTLICQTHHTWGSWILHFLVDITFLEKKISLDSKWSVPSEMFEQVALMLSKTTNGAGLLVFVWPVSSTNSYSVYWWKTKSNKRFENVIHRRMKFRDISQTNQRPKTLCCIQSMKVWMWKF